MCVLNKEWEAEAQTNYQKKVAFRMHKLYNLCTMHKFVHKNKRRTAGGMWGQR